MIINTPGPIVDGLYMVGTPAMPVYLLDGEKPAIFDAGLTFLGDLYADGTRDILGRREPHYCFLTHSHFDHCGAVCVLKKHFPGLKVAAAEKAKNVLGRPNAIELIRNLTLAAEQMAQKIGFELDEFAPFEPFAVDVTLGHGDSIDLSRDLTVEVIETPGHTRDSLSYFIPQKKVLLCSEAAGIPDTTGYIVSEALVDFDQYFASMSRLREVKYEVLCLGHRQALTGRDAQDYFQKSMIHCRQFLERVETALLEEDGDVAKVMARIKAVEYDPVPEPKQIEAAYLLNLAAKVKAIKKRRASGSPNSELAN